MPRFSYKSKQRLATCHPALQDVLREAIKEFDFSILEGHRPVARQQALYAKGRTEPGKKVTNVDGVRVKGMHNYKPSLAADCAPYPLDWKDIERFKEMGEVLKRCAKRLGIKVSYGGDWKRFKDYPHLELDRSYIPQ